MIPPGYKLVPIEPTQAMLEAARSHRPHPNVRKPDHWDSANASVYRRMIAAVPDGVRVDGAPDPYDEDMEALRRTFDCACGNPSDTTSEHSRIHCHTPVGVSASSHQAPCGDTPKE